MDLPNAIETYLKQGKNLGEVLKLNQIQIIARINIFLFLLALCLLCSCTSFSSQEGKLGFQNKKESLYCFPVKADTVDKWSGCSGFFLYRHYFDYVLVIRAGGEMSLKNDSCYTIDIADTTEELSFDVHLDVYPPDSMRQTYCSDIFFTNSTKPRIIQCHSGKINFFLQTLEAEQDVIVTLQLLDAKFNFKGNESHKISIPKKVLFNRVSISNRPG